MAEDERWKKKKVVAVMCKTPSKKPKVKPKRALSAYNIFFRMERQRVQEEGRAKFRDMISNSASDTDSVKTFENLGFVNLAQRIAERWGALDEQSKGYYRRLARQEQIKQYEEQMKWEGSSNSRNASNTKTVHNEDSHDEDEDDDIIEVFQSIPGSTTDTNPTMAFAPITEPFSGSGKFPPNRSSANTTSNLSDLMLAAGFQNSTAPGPSSSAEPCGQTNGGIQSYAALGQSAFTAVGQRAFTPAAPPPSVISPKSALTHALACMPSLPTTWLVSTEPIGEIISPKHQLAHVNWDDQSSTMTQSPAVSQKSTSTRQTHSSSQPSTFSFQQLQSELDEDEKEYLVSCFSTTPFKSNVARDDSPPYHR